MKVEENSNGGSLRTGSISVAQAPLTLAAMEAVLVELRDLEWRAPAGGRSLGSSPWAKDGPWHLAQREVGDIAGDYSETLITNEAGKELQVRKLDSRRPRTPLSMVEVGRLEALRGWLELLPDIVDHQVIWEVGFYLWRGEPVDWKRVKRRMEYPRTTTRLAAHYREALAKLVCAVNGLPARHHKALLARESGYFTSAARRESLGFGTVKW